MDLVSQDPEDEGNEEDGEPAHRDKENQRNQVSYGGVLFLDDAPPGVVAVTALDYL